jgi:cell division septum initiation protein DivIVA
MISISLFDWEQLQQEIADLQKRVAELEVRLRMETESANVWASLALSKYRREPPVPSE